MANYLTLLNPPPPPNEPSTTGWLVNGVLTIADSELVTALRELANHMDLRGPGLLIGNLTGLSINEHLRVTWSIRVPSREQLHRSARPTGSHGRLLIADADRDAQSRSGRLILEAG